MPPAAIALTGVGKVFGSGDRPVTALSAIDLVIEPGKFVTLFGPSGCGKSTLLRIAAGLDLPSQGRVQLFGAAPRDAMARKSISWAPQAPALLPWLTVRQNVNLARRVNRGADRGADPDQVPRPVDQVLDEVGLRGFAGAWPSQLSGGMRQRAALARAFAMGAPLMFMDEPFSALDELTRNELCLRLLEIWERDRKTVLFVTHSAFEAVLLSDRVVVMSPRPGRIHATLAIDLPYPRSWATTETPAFNAIVTAVRRALRDGLAVAA